MSGLRRSDIFGPSLIMFMKLALIAQLFDANQCVSPRVVLPVGASVFSVTPLIGRKRTSNVYLLFGPVSTLRTSDA